MGACDFTGNSRLRWWGRRTSEIANLAYFGGAMECGTARPRLCGERITQEVRFFPLDAKHRRGRAVPLSENRSRLDHHPRHHAPPPAQRAGLPLAALARVAQPRTLPREPRSQVRRLRKCRRDLQSRSGDVTDSGRLRFCRELTAAVVGTVNERDCKSRLLSGRFSSRRKEARPNHEFYWEKLSFASVSQDALCEGFCDPKSRFRLDVAEYGFDGWDDSFLLGFCKTAERPCVKDSVCGGEFAGGEVV